MSLFIAMILFFIAGPCALKWFEFLIQPRGAFDILFGYQLMLGKLYNGSQAQQLLGKALGDCQRCMSFWFGGIWFFVFYGFCNLVLHSWVTAGTSNWISICFINAASFVVFQAICGMLCFLMLTKFMNK